MKRNGVAGIAAERFVRDGDNATTPAEQQVSAQGSR
jgi:hypothetical protein